MLFIPSLEYRKFVQRPRTTDEKNKKLSDLALKEKSVNKSLLPFQEIVNKILNEYRLGIDILDPDIFAKEDIEEFAAENGIENDPLVIQFIGKAKTIAEWI